MARHRHIGDVVTDLSPLKTFPDGPTGTGTRQYRDTIEGYCRLASAMQRDGLVVIRPSAVPHPAGGYDYMYDRADPNEGQTGTVEDYECRDIDATATAAQCVLIKWANGERAWYTATAASYFRVRSAQ